MLQLNFKNLDGRLYESAYDEYVKVCASFQKYVIIKHDKIIDYVIKFFFESIVPKEIAVRAFSYMVKSISLITLIAFPEL